MINARPGYWDVATCSWVGAEPMYVVPPVLRQERLASGEPDRSEPEVPAPRHRREGTPEAPEAPEAAPSSVP